MYKKSSLWFNVFELRHQVTFNRTPCFCNKQKFYVQFFVFLLYRSLYLVAHVICFVKRRERYRTKHSTVMTLATEHNHLDLDHIILLEKEDTHVFGVPTFKWIYIPSNEQHCMDNAVTQYTYIECFHLKGLHTLQHT